MIGCCGSSQSRRNASTSKWSASRFEAEDRLTHGQTRSLVNVDLIDARGIDRSYRPGDSVLADPFRQHLTPFRRQQLGIAQASHAILRIEDDGGSDHGTKQ